ncbi:MAG: hypothetical protein EOO01_03540, partial [Chitinophagaceae bacterium]
MNRSEAGKENTRKDREEQMASKSFKEGVDFVEYNRVRIYDKSGFGQPVEAFGMLSPKGWQVSGEVIWVAPGQPCAGNNMYVQMVSPDGRYKFELFPNDLWSTSSTPELSQFAPNEKYCREGPPQTAREYFSGVFISRDLEGASVLSIEDNSEGQKIISQNNEKAAAELRRYGVAQVNFNPSAIYARVKWNDGREAWVVCGVNNSEIMVLNPYTGGATVNYSSTASNRAMLIYPVREQENAAAMFSVIMGSFKTNPAWKESVDAFWQRFREQRQAESLGKIRMMDALTRQIGENAIRQGQENLERMDASMRSWEAGQQSQDRSHSNFVKAIREVEHYSDASGKVELASGYNQAWSRDDGSSFILSNNPNFDPSSVLQDNRWKEM